MIKRYIISIAGIVLPLSLLSQSVEEYLEVIKSSGEDPYEFICDRLEEYDLVLFDDALHAAVEPFDFYREYIDKYPQTVDYVFLEAVPITAQVYLDKFYNSPELDSTFLAKVFQQDFRYGWPYQTYLELLTCIWEINHSLKESERIKVVGVDQPVYWEGLHTRADYNTFQQSLIARDNFQYNTILKHMDRFTEGKKGIYLTNTRHAYKCIRNKKGDIYWNAGTFFHEWHPGKTYSVRFHNMNLFIESRKQNSENTSTEGLDRLVYKWVRNDEGKWDEAFKLNGNKPVALSFKDNIFGEHPYIGNHMTNVLPGQTFYDAYDALIFTRPLEETKFSAHTGFFYTEEFKKELKHRIEVLHGYDIELFLENNDVSTINEFIEKLVAGSPEKPNPLVN